MVKQDYKKCQFCGENINVEAIKCRYCSEFLIDNNRNSVDKTVHSNKNGCGTFIFIFIALLISAVVIISILANFGKSNNNQYDKDKNAIQTIIDANNRYEACMHTDEYAYQSIVKCINNSNLPVTKYSNTSCNNQLNNIINNYIQAKEICTKVMIYMDGTKLRQGVSVETFSAEFAKCNKAIDQFRSVPMQCGDVKLTK